MPEGEVKFNSVIDEPSELDVIEGERRTSSLIWESSGLRPGPGSIALPEAVQLRLGEEYPDLPPAA
jgi:hypothetical protein